jgi:hypothetical protein
MSDFTGLADLVDAVKEASHNIKRADDAFGQRLDGIEDNINELFRKTSRPGPRAAVTSASSARKRASFCKQRHDLTANKVEEFE